MLPQIDNSIDTTIKQVTLSSKTYKLTNENTRINGYVDNIESIKQAIYHILGVERYSCLIYDDNYGVEFEQYIGKDIEFVSATIENTLREALIQDNRIIDVVVTNITKNNIDSVAVDFNVTTVSGDIIMEVDINV